MRSSLIDAAAANNIAEVRWRLEFNGDDPNTADYDKRTALHVAAGLGHVGMVRLLMKKGASTEVTDRWGNTPAVEATSHRHNTIADLFLGGDGAGDTLESVSKSNSRGMWLNVQTWLTKIL